VYRRKSLAVARVAAGVSVDAVARELDVPPHLIRSWVAEPARVEVLVTSQLEIARALGYQIRERSRVLDLGCGSGALAYGYRDRSFEAYGYDIEDYLSLRSPEDRAFFRIGAASDALPFEDAFFDLVLTDQVLEHVQDQAHFMRELYRVMKPGAISLHTFPARYTLVEPHMYVPFGSVLMHRWWYALWAALGVRNEYQRGLSAREVARENSVFAAEALRYMPSSLYEALCDEIGFECRWFEQEGLGLNRRRLARAAGHVNRVVPLLGWAIRTFHSRRLALAKV
jgi:SAM-dependent methyltransferase